MTRTRLALISPYGGEPRLDNYPEFILAQSLRAEGWDVRLYTYAMRGNAAHARDVIYKGVPVFRCRHRFGIAPRLLFLLAGFRPRFIVSFHPRSNLHFMAYVAARIIGARFIVQVNGVLHDPFVSTDVDDPTRSRIPQPRLLTNVAALMTALMHGTPAAWENFILHMPPAHADGLIAISEEERTLIKQVYGRDAVRIYASAPQLNETPVPQPPLNSDALPQGGYLLFIGQVKLRKGWDTAIDAIAALKQEGTLYHLAFVTPNTDTSVPRSYAEKKGVDDLIWFFSNVSNEERELLYRNAKYVVIPSRYEGFGLPVFEAFTAGKPVCAARIAVFEEFLVDGQNALLFEPSDGAGLAACVQRLDRDSALAQSLVVRGMESAARFSSEKMVAAYKDYFRILAQNKLM